MCHILDSLCEREGESHLVVSDSLQPHALHSPWNSPGQNTGVGRVCCFDVELNGFLYILYINTLLDNCLHISSFSRQSFLLLVFSFLVHKLFSLVIPICLFLFSLP